MKDLKNLIGAQWAEGEGDVLETASPATGASLAKGRTASRGQVAAAMEAAADAFASWKKVPYADREAVILRFAAIAKDRAADMARLIADEAGKALWDAKTEAGAIAGKAALAIASYKDRTPTEKRGDEKLSLRIAHRPHGVMAVIGPFNFPGHLPNGQITPALLAGNSVVFKPSELTPLVGQTMAQWWQEAGLPEGVLNLVQGGQPAGEALLADHHLSGVLFTGGVRAGTAIHKELAGRPEVMLALELGGNNPLIAWDVEDKEGAAKIIIRSAYITSGQRCTCARRLIIDDGPAGDALLDQLHAMLPRLRVGMPLAEPQPFMGPLISEAAAKNALEAQEALIAKGAEPLRPMTTLPEGPAFLSPGLLDVTMMSEHPDEEIFGPLLQVIRVKSFSEALNKANATRFGLAAALLSDKPSLWQEFDQEIRAGIVNWNRQTTGASGTMPFGGPGLSGNHRPAGSYAADFCAWPMASMLAPGALTDEQATIGLDA